MSPLRATAHATSRRVDLSFELDRPLAAGTDRPALRLVRSRFDNPAHPGDGVTVADLTDLFATPGQARVRLERFEFRTTNSATPDGILEGTVTLYYDAPAPGEPTALRVHFFDAASQSMVEDLVEEGSRADRSTIVVAGWAHVDRLEIFHTLGGGAESSAGVLDVFHDNDDPAIANQAVWTPAGGGARTIEFDALQRSIVERTEASTLTFTLQTGAAAALPWVILTNAQDDTAGKIRWSLEVRDQPLDAGVHYYYAIFDLDTGTPLGSAIAFATDDHDSPRKLFLKLPGAYQRADEPDPTQPTGAPGPLRRFLEPVGNTVDLAHSIAEGVRDRYDVNTARLDLLPYLARTIGWAPDLTAPAEKQRRDIHSAPQLFGSVGTIPNVRWLINRATNWPTRVKEFVNNIFLTNAPESIRFWDLWQTENDGTTWSAPTQLTVTADIDARPAVVVDGSGVLWLFFHTDRGGRREIYRQRIGVDAEPLPARAGASDDTADFEATDESPAAVWDGTQLWLFWSSNRAGQWDIWARTFDNSANASDPIRLTDHVRDDRSPAAAVVTGTPARLWLFWSSQRRGPADIWARVLDLTTQVWSDEQRLTEAPLRDDRPAATVDAAGVLWLFWTRDANGRQTLWYKQHDGVQWLDPADAELDVGHRRDESPAAVPFNGGVVLLWHSDQHGPWQIWGRFHDGSAWGDASLLSSSVAGNKEPTAAIDATGNMRVIYRSQRRARRYRSRTLDFADPNMLTAMGTFHDYVHYTYDTGAGNDDWYDRGTVGLYVAPDTVVTSQVEAGVARLRTFVEPFRAVPVRYVWQPESAVFDEELAAEPTSDDEWSDELL